MNSSDSNINYSELVKKAQCGCRESMNRLAQLVEGRLCAYIYRLTLNHDLTQDLLQETLLEMVKSLKKLEHVDAFWSWLYRTAMGKTQHHFRNEQHRRTVQVSTIDKEHLPRFTSPDYHDGLNNMVYKELSDAIFEAIGKLKFRHRNVLVLRCFEQRPYSEIATIMGCSEIAAQVLFFRAKRSLKRQLSKHGFGKGLLLIALGWFARMTTPAKAAPAKAVTAASVKVGLAAAVIGTAGTKLGTTVISLITAAIIIVGGINVLNGNNSSVLPQPARKVSSMSAPGEEAFEYPYQLVDAYNADNDGWTGIEANELVPVRVAPEKWLVGPPPSEQSSVVLPTDHWLELMFPGHVVDGPGYDILLVEWGANGEQARVFITDGAGSEYLLGTVMVGISGLQAPTEIGFDISGISLPFVPCAVRIVGIKGGGRTPGFDLHSVRARIYVSQDDY